LNRKGIAKVGLFSVVLLAIALILIFVLPVFSIPFTSNVNPTNVNASTINQILNFTIVNINATGNITQVNITLSAGFGFIANSNTTTASDTDFSSAGQLVFWTNTTEAGFVANGTAQNFSINVSVPNVSSVAYNFNVSTLDTAGVYNSTNITVTVNDITYPTWSTNQSSTPPNYSTTNLSQFNITWSDNVGIDKVFITIRNSTGVLVNNTSMSNTYDVSIYNYSIVLPAGTFNWTSYANDTSNNWNVSSTWTFTIGNGTVPLILSNNTSLSGTYPYSTNITGSGCPAQINCTLYRNDTGSLGSASDLAQLGVGVYNYTYNTSGNQNYSVNSTSIVLTISKGTPALNVYIDGNSSNETIAYPSIANITANESNSGDSDCIYALWKNTTQLINGSVVWNYTSLGNGTYGPFKYNMSGTCSNWTLGTSSSYYLFVNKGTPTGSISGINVTLPSTTSITPSESNAGDADVNYTFWRDTSLISLANGTASLSADTTSSTAGTYTYKLNSTAGENWTSNSGISTLVITVSAASSSTTGGSSIGGITTTGMITYINLAVGKANITANYLTTGGKLIAKIARYQDVAIRGLNITVVNNVANIKIMVSKTTLLPSTVPYDIDGKVYNYINVDKLNFTDSDIKVVNISFAVNKTWLTNNNVSALNITLYRWSNNKWNDLSAVKVSEDDREAFFTVSSPGLSVFIIGTKGGAPIIPETPAACTESWTCGDWSVCANSQQTRTCTDANSCGTTASRPAETQSCTVSKGETTVAAPVQTSILTTVIVIVVAIIACVFIFLQRVKISSYLGSIAKKTSNHKKTSYLESLAKKVEEEEEEKFADI